MSIQQKQLELTIETLVLVAVWENPFIFQGGFKITPLGSDEAFVFFFRCQSSHGQQRDILHNDFSAYQYEFTHLYNERGAISQISLEKAEDALYLLKYALHVTLCEMLSNRKLHFTSIDDVAMHAMITKIKPILSQAVTFPEDECIGFAVAMDFCPKEETASAAALALLKLKESDNLIQ